MMRVEYVFANDRVTAPRTKAALANAAADARHADWIEANADTAYAENAAASAVGAKVLPRDLRAP